MMILWALMNAIWKNSNEESVVGLTVIQILTFNSHITTIKNCVHFQGYQNILIKRQISFVYQND